VRLPQAIVLEYVITVLTRQAPVIVIAIAAAFIAAGTASGDPSIGSKQAQARAVVAQIAQLDLSLEKERNLYNEATARLHVIDHNLAQNKIGLHAARTNLKKSQKALMARLVTIYQSREDQSTLAVLLGSKSIDDLVNRIEAVQSVSSQDVAVMNEVIGFKKAVVRHRHALQRAHRAQAEVVRERAAAKARLTSEIAEHNRLLASIKNEIVHLIAVQRARALASAAAARARVDAAQQAQALALQETTVGVTASTGTESVAPPSQYGGVVGIAMQYLGTPYVWGGAGPGGFDCSGLVAYSFGQMGISLPHYTGALWGVGVPVSRGDLQPGDLVFFDGLAHVGIYVGGNSFIHAPHTGDVVRISSISGWYADTYVGARRVTG
jgi:cell wall-associated NlpC family hydrolase